MSQKTLSHFPSHALPEGEFPLSAENDYPSETAPLFTSRRHFLRSALLVSGGLLLASPADAMAFFFRPKFFPSSSVDIPAEWERILGPQVKDYALFIQRLRLRHIKAEQIIEPHLKRRGSVQNTLPPKRLWRQMRPTLLATDRLAQHLGEPVRQVISAYRSPTYNARCGASAGSFHVRNMALDLQFRSSPRTVALAARDLREKGVFQGGVGRYSGFTHLDTRGFRSDW